MYEGNSEGHFKRVVDSVAETKKTQVFSPKFQDCETREKDTSNELADKSY